jgi:hypothetical protein
MATSGPRVFDGQQWVSVTDASTASGKPIPPEKDGDGSIFVSIVSYRGTLREIRHRRVGKGTTATHEQFFPLVLFIFVPDCDAPF